MIAKQQGAVDVYQAKVEAGCTPRGVRDHPGIRAKTEALASCEEKLAKVTAERKGKAIYQYARTRPRHLIRKGP
ncbi:MAG: hypothetical protein HKP61_13195 [Dactylosporangium sp.]|nr:hypothetical protein [Dactylosporangium sp.]NNJ61872.1 hypothetical protein [Dactylosporangium sp.]